MAKKRLLDCFCKAGGASVAYARAGFEVVGVDIEPQPNYPFAFIQADALQVIKAIGYLFDVIHASPPCQAYSKLKGLTSKQHPELIEPVRELLQRTGRPYVIENVVGGYIELDCVIHNGINAGTFAFQWAQNSSNVGATTVCAGSYLEWMTL